MMLEVDNLRSSIDKCIKQVYSPARGYDNWQLNDLVGHENILYFSYGRYALAEALICTGIRQGDSVLIPGFICRDLISAVHSTGAVPVYYPVDRGLEISVAPGDLPLSRAIVAVNYFGFPQDLSPFREYCRLTGAVLIEDNAHGLFSRDQEGRFLGTRGDFGVFSLRKTVPMPNGAALVLNMPDRWTLRPQLDFCPGAEPFTFRAKQMLRKIVPWTGPAPIQFATTAARFIRKIRTGHEILPSSPEAERNLPGDAHPCGKLDSYLSSVDLEGEKTRRRELYAFTHVILGDLLCEPVFKELPPNVVPYVYPFYASRGDNDLIKKRLLKHGLECFPWPELPEAVLSGAPDYYKTIWGVRFLW